MNRFRAIPCAAAFGALALSLPASAQETASPPIAETTEVDGDSIVVTGDRERPTRREVNRQARDISAITSGLRAKPLARIEDRLCPGIMGLRTSGAQLMIDRIRWNAERLDMPLADDTACTPNLIVAFVDDGKALINSMEREQGYMFASLTLPERRALLEEDGPVRVWTITADKTRDGMPIPRRESLHNPPVVSMWMAHSKIYLTIRQDIEQVVVLFDREGVRGKSLVQLADYVTMRSFARTKPAGGDAALDTILALFDAQHEPPPGLTDFDQAYLRSVYEGIPNLPASSKLLGVNRELNRLIEREESAE